MKKILFIIPSFERGGTVVSLVNLIKEVHSLPVDISIFAMSQQGPCKSDFKNVHILDRSKLLDFWFSDYGQVHGPEKILVFTIKLFRNLFKKMHILFYIENLLFLLIGGIQQFKQYDTIVAFQEGNTTRFCSYLKATKKIAWIHCNLDYSGFDLTPFASIYAKYDKIVSVSKYISSVFIKYFPNLSEKSDYIYNIIDREELIANSQSVDSDIQRLSPDDVLLVSIGRLVAVKQFSLIPSIANEIKKNIPNIKWFIVGDGEDELNIEHEIINNNVSDVVKLVGYKSNVAPIIKRAALYVCTSKSEACPMAFMEANALNTYIITNGFPSAVELLNPETGIMTTIDDMPSEIVKFLKTYKSSNIYDDSWFLETKNKMSELLMLF